jgi:uncharacterized protein (DUF1330 family)
MNDIVEQYLATWNAHGAERERLLAEHWSPGVRYVDPQADVRGRAELGVLIEGVQSQFPGWVFRRISAVDAHHQQLRFSWGFGPAGEEPAAIGFDVVMLDEEGRIEDVRGFLDALPGPERNAPPGYAVGLLRGVDFGPEIRRYMEEIEATFEPYGGEWLVHGTRPEVLEGPWEGDLVIIGFPSLAAARNWYASPAYQEILELRTAHSHSQVVLLEGVPGGYRAADTIARLVAG